VSPEEWVWGDGTWVFGDGTAEFGEAGTEAALTATGTSQEFTITHNGSIDATNVAVTVQAGTSSISALRYINGTRNEQWGTGNLIAAGQKLVVNGGDRSVWLYGVPIALTYAVNSTGATATISASSAHGLATGDTALIEGTDVFDGIHRNITVTSSTNFTFPSRKYSNFIFAGTMRQLTSRFDNWHDTFNSVWPVLSPGDNVIGVDVTGNATQDATISWEYYEHYA
jgi:hypothetical protein